MTLLNTPIYSFVAIAACAAALGCDSASEDPAFICEEPLGSALQLLPTIFTVFVDPDPCAPATSVLLINQGDEPIRVDALQSGNFVLDSDSPNDGEGELIASAELPQELAPSDSLAIDLRFVSETPEFSGSIDLEVLTSMGCERLTVRGVHPGLDQSIITHPLAVDLGTTSPGTLGEPVDIVFTPTGPQDGRLFAAGGVSAEGGVSNDVFQIDNPIALTPVRSCEPLRMSVRLNAPLETGVYEGLLGWERVSETGSGIGFIHLRGRVE